KGRTDLAPDGALAFGHGRMALLIGQTAVVPATSAGKTTRYLPSMSCTTTPCAPVFWPVSSKLIPRHGMIVWVPGTLSLASVSWIAVGFVDSASLMAWARARMAVNERAEFSVI